MSAIAGIAVASADLGGRCPPSTIGLAELFFIETQRFDVFVGEIAGVFHGDGGVVVQELSCHLFTELGVVAGEDDVHVPGGINRFAHDDALVEIVDHEVHVALVLENHTRHVLVPSIRQLQHDEEEAPGRDLVPKLEVAGFDPTGIVGVTNAFWHISDRCLRCVHLRILFVATFIVLHLKGCSTPTPSSEPLLIQTR